MEIELKPTEVVRIDIYQFEDPHRKEETGETLNTDYCLDLEVEYTLQNNEEYTLTKRFYNTSYRELFGGDFLERMLDNIQTEGEQEIDNIPINLHLLNKGTVRTSRAK